MGLGVVGLGVSVQLKEERSIKMFHLLLYSGTLNFICVGKGNNTLADGMVSVCAPIFRRKNYGTLHKNYNFPFPAQGVAYLCKRKTT